MYLLAALTVFSLHFEVGQLMDDFQCLGALMLGRTSCVLSKPAEAGHQTQEMLGGRFCAAPRSKAVVAAEQVSLAVYAARSTREFSQPSYVGTTTGNEV